MFYIRLTLRQLSKTLGFIVVAMFAPMLGIAELPAAQSSKATSSFLGAKAGEEMSVGGIRFCWCPPGKFSMGSPRSEPERRPDEDQVAVTLTKGGTQMAVGKNLVVLRGVGELIVGEANPIKFTPIARAQVLGGRCWTVPVFANGKLYCRNPQGDLVCLDVAPNKSAR